MATTQPGPHPSETPFDTSNSPPRKKGIRRLLRWIEHLLAATSAFLILMLLTPLPGLLFTSLDRQDKLQPARYVICLGGAPSRVIEGARLIREGYGEKLIVSNNALAAPMMRDLAVDWGVSPTRILVDPDAHKTLDHAATIQRNCGVDPAHDECIIVTSYTHMARSKACFEKAGYKHIIMREPRWERQFRPPPTIRGNYSITPDLIYECVAFAEYWVRGAI